MCQWINIVPVVCFYEIVDLLFCRHKQNKKRRFCSNTSRRPLKQLISRSLGCLWLKLLSHHVGFTSPLSLKCCFSRQKAEISLLSHLCSEWQTGDLLPSEVFILNRSSDVLGSPVTSATTNKTWSGSKQLGWLETWTQMFLTPQPAVENLFSWKKRNHRPHITFRSLCFRHINKNILLDRKKLFKLYKE